MFPEVLSYQWHKQGSDYFMKVGAWGGETERWDRKEHIGRDMNSWTCLVMRLRGWGVHCIVVLSKLYTDVYVYPAMHLKTRSL